MPGSTLSQLRSLPGRTYLRAVPIALVAAVVIGVPADLIDTPIFGRPVPVRGIDYLILAVTAALIGLVFAIRLDGEAEGDEAQQTRTVWGGFVSFLAVGCPVCNQMVVALVGVSGALSWWEPVQPLVGLLAIGLLLAALRQRLATYELTSCPLPTRV
ncbi:MAG: hypothetical protein GY929_25380 [Actinomycetia bacterium]|nr:hypothetical protein [Actinomycetes bacterium]